MKEADEGPPFLFSFSGPIFLLGGGRIKAGIERGLAHAVKWEI